MPTDRKNLTKQWPKRRSKMQETFERVSERHGEKAAPINAFLPGPILNLRRGLAHNLSCDSHDKNRGMTLGEWLDSYLGRYINLSDDQIRQAFNKCSRRVPKEIRPPKPLIVKRMVRGAGFEPARRFRH
jgi:hypothetical protein